MDEVFTWCDQIVTVARGGNIYQYAAAVHELADITKEVPQAYRDITGDPPGTTWETWGVVGASHAPIQIGSFWYRSMLWGVAGEPIDCLAWYDFVRQPATSTTGIQRIINLSEFLEIQAAAGP
jgi:hypothetical protein